MKTSPLNGKTVLIVDDEPELRAAIAYDLKRRGCNIFEASCGDDALVVVKENKIDIVVTDVRMPNGSGMDLLKAIRQINPKIPIVVLATGFADISEDEALKLGAYALLEKPLNRQQMFGLLEESCSILSN